MRQIEFRGLRTEGKGWLYGDLLQWKSRGLCAIVPQEGNEWSNPFDFQVRPETVGRFTGLTDKNGVKIWEGDVERTGGICEWNNDDASFVWNWPDILTAGMESESEWCKITGNIHEQ